MDKGRIEKAANDALKKHRSKNGIIDVVGLARKEGFAVGEVEFDDDTDGIILVDTHADELMGQKTNKLIIVSKERTSAFKRFIIAHELGHYFLHDKRADKDSHILIASRDAKHGRSEEENEYDYFAACLLMPAEDFKKRGEALKNAGLTVNDISCLLSEYYEVPARSAERRLEEVGVI